MEGSNHYSGICKLIWAVKEKHNPQKGREIHLEPSINVCSFYGMLNTIPIISPPHKEVRYYYWASSNASSTNTSITITSNYHESRPERGRVW